MLALARAGLLALLTVGGCTASPGAGGTSIPETPPYLVGVITHRISPRAILVEGQPGSGQREDKAEATVTRQTKLLWRTGARATWEDLRAGQRVSLWITGNVLDSYPVQVEARTVVLEPQVQSWGDVHLLP